MKPEIYDVCLCMDDNWDSISIYLVDEITDSEYILGSPSIIEKKKNIVSIEESSKLKIYPFYFLFSEKHKDIGRWMWRIGNLVCAFLNKNDSLTLAQLSKLLMEHKAKFQLQESEIEWILRCLTARKMIVPKYNKTVVSFSISTNFKMRENQRKFAAAVAGELESLSQRIGSIINHGPTVGTYRENLLQNTLKKHLPERYHIATGFIHGLNKQLDILIYDRIDYAPVFRAGDLVVVPPESVRAVIEVKTKITLSNLQSALELMDLASYMDDNQPPFFKGIFAFESSLKNDTLYQHIADFYSDINAQVNDATGVLISRPFQHLTCICVNNKAFAYIKYDMNKNKRLVPVLYSKSSATELESQSSFFIQSLLAHLKFGGMKPIKVAYMNRMLGEDTFDKKIKDLREIDDSWGAYFDVEEGHAEENAIKQMENLILSSQQWLDGEHNFEINHW